MMAEFFLIVFAVLVARMLWDLLGCLPQIALFLLFLYVIGVLFYS